MFDTNSTNKAQISKPESGRNSLVEITQNMLSEITVKRQSSQILTCIFVTIFKGFKENRSVNSDGKIKRTSNTTTLREGVRFFIQFINANSEVYFIYNYLVAIYAIKKVQVFNLVNKTRP